MAVYTATVRNGVPVRIRLTRRQLEIALLICEGRSSREMADVLWLSKETVEFHRKGLLRATRAKTMPQAIARLFRAGLL
jgi:LuxR family transcriptional regulator